VQSEPEEISATPNQPRLDDRGYCSDDPSLLERPSGNIGGNNAEERKRRMENPLLAAALEHRGQIRLLNKGDSGEWIHVVSPTAPAEQQQQQAIPINAGTAEHLQQIQEEQAKMEAENESLVKNNEGLRRLEYFTTVLELILGLQHRRISSLLLNRCCHCQPAFHISRNLQREFNPTMSNNKFNFHQLL
jgi:hypothetical protein